VISAPAALAADYAPKIYGTPVPFFVLFVVTINFCLLAYVLYVLGRHHALMRALLRELRSQHRKDTYVGEIEGLTEVMAMALEAGKPMDEELRGRVYAAMRSAFSRYHAVGEEHFGPPAANHSVLHRMQDFLSVRRSRHREAPTRVRARVDRRREAGGQRQRLDRARLP
jgi:hypothetical protein